MSMERMDQSMHLEKWNQNNPQKLDCFQFFTTLD